MTGTDIAIIAVILLIIGGKKCIGCPYGDSCGKSKGAYSCGCNDDPKDHK